jgi:hypothetical protein
VIAAPGGHSIAAEERLQATTGEAVGALVDGTARSGIYLASSENGKIRVMMVQLTQPVYDKLAAIGLDHLIIDPWTRPAGRSWKPIRVASRSTKNTTGTSGSATTTPVVRLREVVAGRWFGLPDAAG